jgi:hypothetical protein
MNDRQNTFSIGSAHGLWITVSTALSEAVMTSIDREELFTTTVPYYKVKPRSAELVIVSLDGKAANYLGISQAGRRIATGLITVVVSNVVSINELTVRSYRKICRTDLSTGSLLQRAERIGPLRPCGIRYFNSLRLNDPVLGPS